MVSSLWVLSSPDIIWGRLGTLCLGIQTCENGEVHCLDFSGPKPCEVPEFTTRRWSLWERTTNQWVETSFGFWGPLHAIWWFEKSATVNGCFSENWKRPCPMVTASETSSNGRESVGTFNQHVSTAVFRQQTHDVQVRPDTRCFCSLSQPSFWICHFKGSIWLYVGSLRDLELTWGCFSWSSADKSVQELLDCNYPTLCFPAWALILLCA